MEERNRAAFGAKKKWMVFLGGTALLLLAGVVASQFVRPDSAFPEETQGKGAATRAPASQKERLVATIQLGDTLDRITYDELASECVARHGHEILDNLINRRIIQQACDQQGLEISEAEVRAEIDRIARRFNTDSENWLKILQAERNITPAQYSRDIIWPMLALKKIAGEGVEITAKELKEAFIRNYGERVKARAIVLDNVRRAREVLAKAEADPENFGRLAREYSIDPNSRALDGVIPPIPRYAGHPELEKAVFKLKEGEISAVIQVDANQYMIVKCEGRTEQVVHDIKEVQTHLEEQLHEEKVQQAVASVFENLKESARVENYMTRVVTGGDRKPGAKGSKASTVRQTSGAAPAGAAPAAAARRAAATEEEPEEGTARPGAGNLPARRPPKAPKQVP
jgi:foldase protein PrsA